MKKRGQKKPGYYLNGHMFPCVRRLRPMFGAHDAAIQSNQIILLHFEDEYRHNLDGKLLELSAKYKVSPGNSNFAFVKRSIAEMNITSTYTLVDRFLKDFISDCVKYKKMDWKYKNKDGDLLDPLNQIIFNLPYSKSKLITQIPEYSLLDYYRHVRNQIIHPNAQNLSRLNKKHMELVNSYGEHWMGIYKIMPNEYEQISYNDYFIYTRAVKYFVNALNNIVELTTEEIVIAAQQDVTLRKRLRSCEQIRTLSIRNKRIIALRSFYREYFSYGRNRGLEDSFLEQYKKIDSVSWDKN